MKRKKVILITGASSGIGLVSAMELAKTGDIIVLLCRNEARGKKAQEEVKTFSENECIYLMICDFSSLNNIYNFCEEFKKKFVYLDILINNAGMMDLERKITSDGFEAHFQVNYLSPFLLTYLLLDIIKPSGRIINVSSLAEKIGNIHFEDINLLNKYSVFKAYSQSKLAITLFTFELSRRLKDVTVNCLHPGIILSNLGIYKEKKLINFITNKLKILFCSKEKGAEAIIFLATDDSVDDVTGKYFVKKKVKKASKKANDIYLAKKLWDYTKCILNL